MTLEVKDNETGAIKLIGDEDKIEAIFMKIINTQISADCFFAGIAVIYKDISFKLIE